MKQLCVAIFCVVFVFSSGLCFAAHDEAVIAKERSMWELIKKGDFKSFSSNLGENVINVEADGRILAKAEMMKNLEKFKLESYNLAEIKVEWLNENTALLTYKATVKGKSDTQQVNGDFRCASIWVQEGDKWIGRFHQETPIVPMPTQ